MVSLAVHVQNSNVKFNKVNNGSYLVFIAI